jgi:histidine triad (HIT) family protein
MSLERSQAAACVFCGIVTRVEPSRVIGANGGAVAFLDINPAGQGHTLVVPRSHADNIWDLTPESGEAVWRLTMDVARRLKEVLRPDGLTLFQANGGAGWQDVFHFHMHLVPRWTNDELTKPWTSTAGDPQELDALAARLT